MRTSVSRFLLYLAVHPGLHRWRRGARLAALVLRFQSRDAVSLKALLPTRNRWCGGPKGLLDLDVALTISKCEDQPRSKDISSRQRSRLGPAAQFFALFRCEDQQLPISCHTE